ncbi:hypothetical protein U1Q18_005207 [Sarracenia purpurea var. burkii]
MWEVMVNSMIDRTESSSATSQWQRRERGDGSESEIEKTNKLNDSGRKSEVESSKTLSSEKMASLTLENALQSSEISDAHSSHHSNSGNPDGRYDSSRKSSQEANIFYDVNDQIVSANDHKEVLEFIKDQLMLGN